MKLYQLIFAVVALIFQNVSATAQIPTIQDCAGAIEICQSIYEQNSSFEGEGNFPAEIDPLNGSCLTSGEINSVWYVFTIAEDGFLSFVLTPNDPADDYDWAVFNISENDCADIYSNPDMMVSCNSYGLADPLDNGPTGISTALGGVGNSNGPGDIGSLPFNEDLPVQAGDTYVLLVEDWEDNAGNVSTGSGYVLDFSNTTATIYDDIQPEITEVSMDCDQSLTVTFSEPINCTTIDLDAFILKDSSGTEYPLANFYSDCSNSNTFTNSVNLIYDVDLETTGNDFTLYLVNEVLADACNNTISIDSFPFQGEFYHQPLFQLEDIATCSDSQGGVELAPTGVEDPDNYNWLWNTGETTSSIITDTTGTFIYHVTNPCYSMVDTVHVVVYPTVSFSDIDGVCSLQALLQQDGTTVVPGDWSAIPAEGVEFGNPIVSTTLATVPDYGTYTFIFTDNNCQIESSMEVTYVSEPEFTLTGNQFCLEDGVVAVAPEGENLSGISWLWSDGTTTRVDSIETSGTYVLSGSNLCGTTSDTATFSFLPCQLTIPNVFTPNGDATIDSPNNDAFVIDDITQFPGSKLTVFNRWGNVVYSSDSYQNDWSPSESEIAEGSYYYILDQKFADGTIESHVGYITILR